ncbi:protein indeterminate-domain 9-like [Cynara cardunculus var. scolymus]|uniref:Zinc finger, C2H2 n=1 Tax=Cynara cardunculus var. scolymus TaxID=59895 RepID=A0A103XHH2_CYNCS|nr:protein indeterminate-domain 9-like [Cynara cardunculus var. scolymus]KVH90800.1 Zinc finger, C2H2 [Cynara cardunculus var. scolymus]
MMSGGDGFNSSSPSSLTASLIQDPISNPNPNSSSSAKRKRNLPGTPDPDAEVIALSPRSLMATNRFVCEICNKGFQRDQNLQLHRRGHNLPWKLKQRNKLEVVKKKVYICPEKSCVHHDPSRALGDLTGVKKHFSRKHGEKKWKCEKCSKKYAVQSDWKAHSKICGTREYKCDCGTLFSRKDSFITHRAFCDALTEENSRMASFPMMSSTAHLNFRNDLMMINGGGGGGQLRFPGMFGGGMLESTNLDANGAKPRLPIWLDQHGNESHLENPSNSSFLGSSSSNNNNNGGILPSEMVQWLNGGQETVATYSGLHLKEEDNKGEMQFNSLYNNYTTSNTTPPPPPPPPPPAHMSATALLQKAAQMGSTRSTNGGATDQGFGLMTTSLSNFSSSNHHDINGDGLMMMMTGSKQSKGNESISHDGNLTRDFLGVGGNERRPFDLQQELFNFSSSMEN